MKISTIKSTWLPKCGFRLDCSPYLGGAIETEILLDQLPVRKDTLGSITKAIYHAGRESRQWVEYPEFGVPFLGAGQLQRADLSDLPLISKAQVASTPAFIVRPSWTLITRSGTIGKMAYCRPDMDGLAVSEDVLRVVADEDRIPPGYLYAFLSSKFGVPLITSGTYGAIIQHLEPSHITGLSVPRFGDAIEQEIHQLVEEAARLRSNASTILTDAENALIEELGTSPDLGIRRSGGMTSEVSVSEVFETRRLDPWFFSVRAETTDHWIRNYRRGVWRLGDIAAVYGVPPFKRVYIPESEHGIGFFGSASIFNLDRTPDAFISSIATKGVEKYILSEGMLLMASSGQLNGIIGRPQYVDSSIHSMAASNHVLRIVPQSECLGAGTMLAYFGSNRMGRPLVLRTATGDSIPEIWPVYLNEIPVPKFPESLSKNVDKAVVSALEQRVFATSLEMKAKSLVEKQIEGY